MEIKITMTKSLMALAKTAIRIVKANMATYFLLLLASRSYITSGADIIGLKGFILLDAMSTEKVINAFYAITSPKLHMPATPGRICLQMHILQIQDLYLHIDNSLIRNFAKMQIAWKDRNKL